ncbi:hypothetical protein BCR33DRAFT_711776 [Rhizoclosmatium globosum]|uniref:Uncharacterized protein n=1 Tax=Rhizoclosmatium globosum TaxID=329046 RepID=A0A1Y2CZK7_9FUNG|nr:hypothetical protein BCR33DRAFT_711776 [Rhizoclosmatium globosum]|eukprot:ORY52463.1 hypothetical protein BCR33DRAFT_711776 [Rhizoclosmatium globosum]
MFAALRQRLQDQRNKTAITSIMSEFSTLTPKAQQGGRAQQDRQLRIVQEKVDNFLFEVQLQGPSASIF